MRDGNTVRVKYVGVYYPSVMSDLDVAVGAAVDSAKETYDAGDAHPFDHGFAHIAGVDGRTRLADALREHPDVRAENYDHVTVSGVTRYLTPQREAYRAFIETLEDYGVDTSDLHVRGRLD